MIRRNVDTSQAIAEIEAHHAARRAKGKAITAGALARLATLRAPPEPRHLEPECDRANRGISPRLLAALAMAAVARGNR